ncbi:MAG: hypothetical protein U0325_28910 [Polyangiales bacterium]
MRRALPLLAVLTLPLAGDAQETGARLHRNLPASYPFESLPRGVVVPPMNREAMRAASGGAGWSESQRPADEVLRPREAWAPSTHELDPNTRSPAGTQLAYREVFTPSVSPFKRTQSFDAVDARGRLFVRNPVLRPLAVGPSGLTGPTQRFTGDANLELSPDNPTPLPSVAAESFVVGYRTTPQVQVAFFQDSAGNLFVRGERVATVRLSWVLEAPERMFVPASVPAAPLSEVARRLGVAAPAVPSFLSADAPAVVAHFGLTARGDLASTLARLTERFRAFRDADLPAPPSASLYRARHRGRGACRHRAYALALTLMALGVPARFVGNEAHAGPRCSSPRTGWTRIDLGGWDAWLREQGPAARPAFVPRQPDPFPRPPEYTNGRTSTRGAAAPEGNAPPPSPTLAPSPAPAPSPGMAEAPGVSEEPGERASAGPGGVPRPGAVGAATRAVAGGTGNAAGVMSGGVYPSPEVSPSAREASAAPEPPPRARTVLRLDEVTAQGRAGERLDFVRGTLVRCAGSATDDEQRPVADLAVQVELLRDGSPVMVERNGRRSVALGSTTTGPDGRFDAQVLLPVELGAGSYELRVRTPGDARHLPARSE